MLGNMWSLYKVLRLLIGFVVDSIEISFFVRQSLRQRSTSLYRTLTAIFVTVKKSNRAVDLLE